MDTAVALVQAYLRVNGYFTVAEYPVVEATRGGNPRTLTDIDILAFRFPGAGRLSGSNDQRTVDPERHEPDPLLGGNVAVADMIVGEVKEGRARLNDAALHPDVLRAALVRFGCCSPNEAPAIVSELKQNGSTSTQAGHRIRIVTFGSLGDESASPAITFISLGHVAEYLMEHIREHWDLVRHVQTKDPVLGLLLTLEKARRGSQ